MLRVLRVLLLNAHHDAIGEGTHVIPPQEAMDVALAWIEIIVEWISFFGGEGFGSRRQTILFSVACF
jgi:hypothetical protein